MTPRTNTLSKAGMARALKTIVYETADLSFMRMWDATMYRESDSDYVLDGLDILIEEARIDLIADIFTNTLGFEGVDIN